MMVWVSWCEAMHILPMFDHETSHRARNSKMCYFLHLVASGQLLQLVQDSDCWLMWDMDYYLSNQTQL